MPEVKCKVCQNPFYIKPYHLKKGWGKYCSKLCQNLGQKTGQHVLCTTCSKEVWKMQKELRHSKSQKFFCSKSCQTIWRNKQYIGSKHPNWVNGINSYRKLMQNHKISPVCRDCKLTDKRVLIVHHIDHDRTNNKISNLVWLCRNCHYIIHEGKTI